MQILITTSKSPDLKITAQKNFKSAHCKKQICNADWNSWLLDHLVGGGDPIYAAVFSSDHCWGLGWSFLTIFFAECKLCLGEKDVEKTRPYSECFRPKSSLLLSARCQLVFRNWGVALKSQLIPTETRAQQCMYLPKCDQIWGSKSAKVEYRGIPLCHGLINGDRNLGLRASVASLCHPYLSYIDHVFANNVVYYISLSALSSVTIP